MDVSEAVTLWNIPIMFTTTMVPITRAIPIPISLVVMAEAPLVGWLVVILPT